MTTAFRNDAAPVINQALVNQLQAMRGWLVGNDPATIGLLMVARRKAIRRVLAEIRWPFKPDAWPTDRRWYDRMYRPRYALVHGAWTDPEVMKRIQREVRDLQRKTRILGERDGLLAWCEEADGWPRDEGCDLSLWDVIPGDLELARRMIAEAAGRMPGKGAAA